MPVQAARELPVPRNSHTVLEYRGRYNFFKLENNVSIKVAIAISIAIGFVVFIFNFSGGLPPPRKIKK